MARKPQPKSPPVLPAVDPKGPATALSTALSIGGRVECETIAPIDAARSGRKRTGSGRCAVDGKRTEITRTDRRIERAPAHRPFSETPFRVWERAAIPRERGAEPPRTRSAHSILGATPTSPINEIARAPSVVKSHLGDPPPLVRRRSEVTVEHTRSALDDVWTDTDAPRLPFSNSNRLLPLPACTAALDEQSTEEFDVASVCFGAVEVCSEIGGQIVDITLLQKVGEQFVLGHPTPQGSVAPAAAHPGLRLLRINPDRTVDLIFPCDASGSLIRGTEVVSFAELAGGRKYSRVRLELRDRATIALGRPGNRVTYHIRFREPPHGMHRST